MGWPGYQWKLCLKSFALTVVASVRPGRARASLTLTTKTHFSDIADDGRDLSKLRFKARRDERRY